MRLQKQRRRHPGLAETNHQNAFIFEFHQVHFTTLRFAPGRLRLTETVRKLSQKKNPPMTDDPVFLEAKDQ
jgi:hypothetical protein